MPILWVSKLQTEIMLSTTEVEYIALSQVMWDLIPLMMIVKEVSVILQIEYSVPGVQYKHNKTTISADVYEDNRGAPELVNFQKL